MKTSGVSCVPKFRVLVFLGHPNALASFYLKIFRFPVNQDNQDNQDNQGNHDNHYNKINQDN